MSNEDLTAIPAKEIEVKSQKTNLQSKIGDEEFIKKFLELMKHGPLWRSLVTLAEKLGVDATDLSSWLDKRNELTRRSGKEDGIVYYALLQRMIQPREKPPPGMERKPIQEEDRYMVAELHMIYNNLCTVLDKYGLRLYERNEEAFKAVLNGRDRLSSGITQVFHTFQVNPEKLPKF